MDVFLELENARTSDDRLQAMKSLRSILDAQSALVRGGEEGATLWIVRSPSIAAEFLDAVMTEVARSPGLLVEHVEMEGPGYFSAKNSALRYGVDDVLVFCDSDCVYQEDFLLKMSAALRDDGDRVVYGTTFAAEASGFGAISALTWLFPPRSVGYGDSWPRSRWANNFALRRSILRESPFPSITSRRWVDHECKQERPLWEAHTRALGLRHEEVDAVAFHSQFDRLGAWIARQWVHAIGTTGAARAEGKGAREILSRVRQPLQRRGIQLRELAAAHRSELPLRRARAVLAVGLLVRSVGCLLALGLRHRLRITW